MPECERICNDCNHWLHTPSGGIKSGLCRRYPPCFISWDDSTHTPDGNIRITNQIAYEQPTTRHFDTCGEWSNAL